MRLGKRLNRLGNLVLDQYPNINCGGCCVFAAAVGAELQAMGIETRVIVAAHREKSDINLNQIRQYLEFPTEKAEWNSEGIWFDHVALEIVLNGKKLHYDVHGVRRANVWKFGDYILYKGWMSIEDATALADEEQGWSSVFARENVYPLRRMIKRFFKNEIKVDH